MTPWSNKNNFFLEFVCEDSFGVACPSGVDKDLWSRFQAFEKWNATHWVIFMTSFQHVINPIFYLTWNQWHLSVIRVRRSDVEPWGRYWFSVVYSVDSTAFLNVIIIRWNRSKVPMPRTKQITAHELQRVNIGKQDSMTATISVMYLDFPIYNRLLFVFLPDIFKRIWASKILCGKCHITMVI